MRHARCYSNYQTIKTKGEKLSTFYCCPYAFKRRGAIGSIGAFATNNQRQVDSSQFGFQ
jgi:hypothetical protein